MMRIHRWRYLWRQCPHQHNRTKADLVRWAPISPCDISNVHVLITADLVRIGHLLNRIHHANR